MTADIYKPIPDWPEYEISSAGDVRRVMAAYGAQVGKSIKWQLLKEGYAKVSLCRNAKRREYLVHRLVALTFIGPIPEKMDVCHFDGNKLNNSVTNLRIDTRKGNMADQIRMGKTPRGEKCGSNRYSAEAVLRVREMAANGVRKCDIARAVGMSQQNVSNILAGRVWGWL